MPNPLIQSAATPKTLIVFGNNTAKEIGEIAKQQLSQHFDNISCCYFCESTPATEQLDRFTANECDNYFTIGIAKQNLRRLIRDASLAAGFTPFTIIHSSAVIPDSAQVGKGCFIGPNVSISTAASIGDYSLLHFNSSIGHDSKIGRDCIILPGARIGGNVTLGDQVMVGSNSFIAQGVTVGEKTDIDALTYVHKDTDSNMLVSCRSSHHTLPKVLK